VPSESLPASETLERDCSRLLRTIQVELRLPSVSALVFRGGDPVWEEAIGLADAEGGDPVTPDHQYRIGSITKTFTAAAIMQLRDAGKLQLDDPLGAHVTESAHQQPTLRRLLSHHSGLQREPPGEIWEPMRMPTRERLLETFAEAEQVLAPAAHWHYSNLGFALLGEVVARSAGMPYEDYVSANLLEPLGLDRTTWTASPPVARGYFVEPYADRLQAEPFDVDLLGVAAAGGLWSTARDLSRWGAFLADPNPDILAPETVDEMHMLQVMATPDAWDLGWGLGIMLFRKGERLFAGHDGGMPGHVAILRYARKEKVGAVLLIGSSAPGPRVGEVGLELAQKAAEAFPVEPEPWAPEDPPPAELEGVLGRWWTEGTEFVFRWRNGRLEARWAQAPPELEPALFEPESPDRLRTVSGRERGEILRIVRDEGGEVVKLYWATYPLTRVPETFGP
jgi:CubicO group peptidase (beta-lactamase class C family)